MPRGKVAGARTECQCPLYHQHTSRSSHYPRRPAANDRVKTLLALLVCDCKEWHAVTVRARLIERSCTGKCHPANLQLRPLCEITGRQGPGTGKAEESNCDKTRPASVCWNLPSTANASGGGSARRSVAHNDTWSHNEQVVIKRQSRWRLVTKGS